MGTVCPRCRQNAPLVYRGVSAYCTACGAPRMPLANASVTHAGQPSKVGGTVARVFGWLVLAGGWIVAALLAGLIMLLGGQEGAVISFGLIGGVASLIAYALLRSGRELKLAGEGAEETMKNQAVFALAGTRGGVLRAFDVAQMLHVNVQEADDLLTKLAKTQSEQVSVDIDDEGTLLYRFNTIHWREGMPHVRVGSPVQTRVDAMQGEPLEEEFAESAPVGRKAR